MIFRCYIKQWVAGFLFLITALSFNSVSCAQTLPVTVFRPPYSPELAAETESTADVGMAECLAKANTSTGFMGVYGNGFTGGASSRAGFRFVFLSPERRTIKVKARVKYMGGISGFGYADVSGFRFEASANNGKVHSYKIEGGINTGWVLDKTLDLAGMATGLIEVPVEYKTIKTINDLMDLLDYLQTLNDFLTVMENIKESLSEEKTTTITFAFTAREGQNEIDIALKGGVGAFITGQASYIVLGYLEELRIEGLGYPDLVVDDFSVTSRNSWQAPLPETGKEALLEFNIRNYGNYRSKPTDVEIDIADQKFTRQLPALGPGESKRYSLDFRFPEKETSIIINVDPLHKLYESGHDWKNIFAGKRGVELVNNGNLLRLKVYGVEPWEPRQPDLTFSEPPASVEVEAGRSATISFRIINKPTSYNRYGRAEDVRNLTVKASIEDLGWEDTKTIPLLKSGEVIDVDFQTPPLKDTGQVEVVIDPDNRIKERNETNNRHTAYLIVKPPIYPQLEAAGLRISPLKNQYIEGEGITLTAGVRYWDEENRPIKNIEVGFYYNQSGSPDVLNLKEIGKRTITFPSSGVQEVSIPWQVTNTGARQTDLYVIVDPHNRVREIDESSSIHQWMRGIRVKKVEVSEKPLEGVTLKNGVDFAVTETGIFLNKETMIASDYLGVWVKNLGDQGADAWLQFRGYWIKGKEIKEGILGNLKGHIAPAKARLFKLSLKNLQNKDVIFSKNLKIVIDVKNPADIEPANNQAIFRIGNFDQQAHMIRQAGQEQKNQYYSRPDIAIWEIRNTKRPLKVNEKRRFEVIVHNNSEIDATNVIVNSIIRPEGSRRRHPGLWQEYKKTIAHIRASHSLSIPIDYQAKEQGEYEIVASVESIKWQGLQRPDANRNNNSMIKHFAVGTRPATEASSQVDLSLKNIWIDNKTPNVGEIITGGFTIYNASSRLIQDIPWQVLSNGKPIASGSIKSIAPGKEYAVKVSSKADREGVFWIKAVIDPFNRIEEKNERNNSRSIRLKIEKKGTPGTPQVDLTVARLSLGKRVLRLGESTQAVAEVKNIGRDTVYAVAVHLQINDRSLFVKIIKELKGGQTRRITFPIKAILPGQYRVRVVVDKRNLIRESDEKNNFREQELTIKLPF
ncbi:MAG: hypothetical protein GXO97_06750 [Nitrospirae bacterium]|nr:hypothetical protein [Nitrospirota bacterium]